jgi:DNA-binding NarL/FixJ family response regulator
VQLKIVIADGHRLMLEGIRLALAGAADIDVVGTTTSGREVLRLVELSAPDVILLGLGLGGADGLRCLQELRERHPRVKAIVLSGREEPEVVEAAFRNGAAGFVVKRIDPAALAPVIRQVVEGNVYHPIAAAPADVTRGGVLTRREADILKAVASGLSNKQVARDLWLSEQTVKFHLSNVYRKLGVSCRTAAINAAYARGLIENPLLAAA